MRPLIYALHDRFDEMQFCPETRCITNEQPLLQHIVGSYALDAAMIEHIQIVKAPAGFHFGLGGMPIEDLLLPALDAPALGRLRRKHFPALGTEMLFAALWGIHQIINSAHLDIRYDVNQPDDTHWYYQKTKNGCTLNRQYVYEGFQDYILTQEKAEFFYHYLTATSSGPEGGLKTIAYFDAAKINDTSTIVIAGTQVSYADVLHAVVEDAYFHKRILKSGAFQSKPAPAAVRAGLLFLEKLWGCFTIEGGGKASVSPFDARKGLIIREKTYQNITWQQGEKAGIYESCRFQGVDFSGQLIEDDFIFCTFEACNFAGMTTPPEGVQSRFPILRCVFISCKNIPRNAGFQNGIAGCTFMDA